jgi:hypothetical protein
MNLVINKPIRCIWAVLIHFEQKCNGSLDQCITLHIHCCHLVANLYCAWVCILKMATKFFSLSFTRSDVLFSYINFTFPQTSKCLQEYASGSELQVVRFGYVILGKNVIKGQILINTIN